MTLILLSISTIIKLLCTVVLVSYSIKFLKYAIKVYFYLKSVPSKRLEPTFFFKFLKGQNPSFLSDDCESRGHQLTAYFFELMTGINYLMRKEHVHVIWIGCVPFYHVNTPEAIEEIMNGTKANDKSWMYGWLHCWLGTGLLTSKGKKWKSRRKLLTPAFHFDILKDFLPIINEKSVQLVRKLRETVSCDYTNITPMIALCSLDIICETTLGVNIKAQQNTESEYITSVGRVSEMLTNRLFSFLCWIDFTFFLTRGKHIKKDLELLHNFTMSVIRERKKNMLLNEKHISQNKRKPLIDVLLIHQMENKDLTDEDIREEVDTFAFEGHDTTAMAITWALYLIGLYKDVQDKIYEELFSIFGDDTERPVTKEDIAEMKYLDCVLKESLRLYPSVPMIAREADKDMTVCGYPIFKGMPIGIYIYLLHRNEDIYPNPEIFDPNRFTPEASAKRHPYAYIPFAAGPRNCIGQRFAMMENKVVVANVLRNFTLESLDPRDKIPISIELILRPSKPIRIRVRPRH